jgi:ATPase family associated with various cellular activities (AAA)
MLQVTGRIIIDAKSWNRNTYDGDRYLEPLNLSEDGGDTESDLDHATGYTKDGMIKLPSVESGKEPARLRLREEHHLICSPRVKGFSFKLKQWRKCSSIPTPTQHLLHNTSHHPEIVEFFVDLTAQIQWNTHAFDKLVLPPDQKELLLSFAESQVTDKALFDDIIEGKGKGIIILLSGPPGVGKTLTAESIAENMHAPLYMISAGDLGVTPEQIEYKLTNVLSMIASWNSVLLLDECDVFLEARSAHDLERNKLVSIFLRVLEYYEGILFLTTNRIDNIDPAFQSRIHVSMAYPELNAKSQRHIWANFLEGRKGGDSAAHEFTEQDLDELAEVGLNGRQIKNVLKTAQLLASRKKCPLRREFVETVLAIERRRPGIP